MTAERYDGADWPATISVGPGYYGLRIDTDHGTAVEYVDARSLYPMRQEPDEGTSLRAGPRDGPEAGCKSAASARSWFDSNPAHRGATCEAA